jgi:hypothetical protein
MDEAFTDGEIAAMSGLQGIRDRVLRACGKKNPTVRDFIHFSGRGRVHNAVVGGPKEIADRLEQWFVERACDGFVVSATHVPGAYEATLRSSAVHQIEHAMFFFARARILPERPCGRILGCPFRRWPTGAGRGRKLRGEAALMRRNAYLIAMWTIVDG